MIMATIILMIIVSSFLFLSFGLKQIMFVNFHVENCTIEPFLWIPRETFCMWEAWTESFDWLSKTSIVHDVKEDKIPCLLNRVIPTVVKTRESLDTTSVEITYESFNRSKHTEAINSMSVEPMLTLPRITSSMQTWLQTLETKHIMALAMELPSVPLILKTMQRLFGSRMETQEDFLVFTREQWPSLPKQTRSSFELICTTRVQERRLTISREPSNTTQSGSTVSI